MAIRICVHEETFLKPYRPLLTSKADVNFLWGGRDSGKSYYIACRLLLRCMQPDYFRCILIKKTFESIKDSQWQLLQDIATEWGVDQYFVFKSSPLEIICLLNGNTFIARGCDKPAKLKSISNPSHAWYEEGNQLTEADYITASTTLRSKKGRVQEWFSFNPEAEEDYADFWLYKQFFQENYEKGIYSFTGSHAMPLPNGSEVTLTYTSTHTTYKDNPFCSPDRIARHETLKKTNPYFYKVFTLGIWGRKISGGEIYKCYSPNLHVGPTAYNPELPLHLTFDFNVNPYMTSGIWQINGKKADKINEILLPHPRNTSLAVCGEFTRIYQSHTAGLFIYGDPGGLKQSTADETLVRVKEKDYNEFTKILHALAKFRPSMRVSRNYPPVKLRVDFFNTILAENYEGIQITFGENCKRSHAEYSNLKEASDGTKHKEMYEDENTGVRCQKWGHISDADDYFLTMAFASEFGRYQSDGQIPKITTGKSYSKNNY